MNAESLIFLRLKCNDDNYLKEIRKLNSQCRVCSLDNRFRHIDKDIHNIMKKTVTDEELDGFMTYLLKNTT